MKTTFRNRAWEITGLGLALAIIIVAAAATGCRRGAPAAQTLKTIDDFETEPQGWTVAPGPGAKGSLTRDTATVAHGGQGSYKLEFDFSGGGQYVEIWKDLSNLGGDVTEFSLWVKVVNLKDFGVYLVDSTGQILQSGAKLTSANDWQHIVLPVQSFLGGAKDGKWHGPAKSFGIKVGKGVFAQEGSAQATLWIDDLAAAVVAP